MHRTTTNLRAAMVHQPRAAFGLLIELAHATDNGVDPRRVDDGMPQNDSKATAAVAAERLLKEVEWSRRNNRARVTCHRILLPQSAFQNAVTADLINAVKALCTAGVSPT